MRITLSTFSVHAPSRSANFLARMLYEPVTTLEISGLQAEMAATESDSQRLPYPVNSEGDDDLTQ